MTGEKEENKLEKELKKEIEVNIKTKNQYANYTNEVSYYQNEAIIAQNKLTHLYQTQTLRYLKKLAGE